MLACRAMCACALRFDKLVGEVRIPAMPLFLFDMVNHGIGVLIRTCFKSSEKVILGSLSPEPEVELATETWHVSEG